MKPIRRKPVFRRVADLNVTPLIDVLLVLLVIFMVITPQTSQGLDTRVPVPGGNQDARPEESLILTLDSLGNIRLNSTSVEPGALQTLLEDVLRTRGDRTVFVQADDQVLFNEVAQLIDTARGAGADRVGLMTRRATVR